LKEDVVSVVTNFDKAAIIYIVIVGVSLIPTIKAIFKKIKLHPGGDSFDKSNFSNTGKDLLSSHYTRINGTLVFWKNQAEKFRFFHYYVIFWSATVGIIVPILIQYNSTNQARVLLTIMTVHIAVIQSLHKVFKVENSYKAFRLGESEFYDLYRRMLDMPEKFGEDEDVQITTYFEKVELIRVKVRNSEVDNLPFLEKKE